MKRILCAWALTAMSCQCGTDYANKRYTCTSDEQCVGVPCLQGVCGGLGTGGGSAGGTAGGAAGGDAGGTAGGSAGGTAGGSAGGTAGGAAGGSAGGTAGGAAGGAAGGTAGGASGPTQLVFTSPTRTLAAGDCSPQTTLQFRNAGGTATPVTSDTTVMLSSTLAGVTFFSNASCTTGVSGISVAAGSSAASFYFRGITGGTANLSATATPLSPAMQSETIVGVLRTGTCAISAGSTSIGCTVAPPVSDVSHAMLFFQATSADANPTNSEAKCMLTAAGTVTCSRFSATNTVRIQWQVADLPQRLYVQHLNPTCFNMPGIDVTFSAVDAGSTLMLFGHLQDGMNLAADDSYTTELIDPTTLRVTSGGADAGFVCSDGWAGGIQMVQLEGASVTRGGTAGAMTLSGLSSAPTASSALLFTYGLAGDTPAVCQFMLRGEMPSATSLSFTRGLTDPAGICNNIAVQDVTWQRVDFGPRATVQSFSVSMAAGTSVATATINAVDVTRTLVFSSNQVTCGQGSGEGEYAGDDILGELCATFELSSSTQVRVQREATFAPGKWTGYAVQLNP